MRGVPITGLGIVSSLGCGTQCHLESIRAGRCGLRPLTLFDTKGLPSSPVGQVEEPWLKEVQGHRSISLALNAARQAIRPANLDLPGSIPLGTTTGAIFESEQHYLKFRGGKGSSA